MAGASALSSAPSMQTEPGVAHAMLPASGALPVILG
jgi:hypothetical protein